MFKIVLTLLLILWCQQYSNAECVIILPSERELKDLFKKWGLEHFARTTGIIKDWASLECYPEALEESKFIWLAQYQEITQDPSFEVMKSQLALAFKQTAINLDELIDELLQDNPKAQKQLKVFREKINSKKYVSSKKRKTLCLIC